MRKILGASRWNVFGPGQSAASWVEMGSVKAGGGANRVRRGSLTGGWRPKTHEVSVCVCVCVCFSFRGVPDFGSELVFLTQMVL